MRFNARYQVKFLIGHSEFPSKNKFGFCVCLSLHSSFAIKTMWKRELVDLLLLSYGCLVAVNGLWLLLTVPWFGLHCVIVVLPDHTHLVFLSSRKT